MLKMRRVPTSCCYRSEKHSFVRCLRAHRVYNHGKQTSEIQLDLFFNVWEMKKGCVNRCCWLLVFPDEDFSNCSKWVCVFEVVDMYLR
jgi:hypothetical protein